MKTLTTVLLLVLAKHIHAQTTLGVGLVKIQFDDKPVIDFYKKPTDQNFRHRIYFYRDSVSKGIKIKDFEAVSHWLKPEVLWLDDFQFNFRCKSVKEGWFEVVVNNDNGHTFWIKNDRSTKFIGWEEYLRDMVTISRNAYLKQKIRKQPDDKSEEIKYEGQDCFQVKSLRKNWIEIFTPPTCSTQLESGWIRWRHGNKLLIEY